MQFAMFMDTVDRVVYVNPMNVCYVNRQIRDDNIDSSWITFANEEISVLGSPHDVVKILEEAIRGEQGEEVTTFRLSPEEMIAEIMKGFKNGKS